jgi:hypothetical protein
VDEIGPDEAGGARDEKAPEAAAAAHVIGGPAVQSYPMPGSSWAIRPSSSGE